VDDPHVLPANLPVPVDDGKAAHLPGRELPDLSFASTADGDAPTGLGDVSRDATLVLYIYPQAGFPGGQVPEGWNDLPGARGCTAQSCAFRDHAAALRRLGATLFGLSAQPLDQQRAFAAREHLPYPLLHDGAFTLAEALDLPTFSFEGGRYYRRLTLIAVHGAIEKVFYPVFPPDGNASQVEAWLRERAS
jgi:peroxiredoxin